MKSILINKNRYLFYYTITLYRKSSEDEKIIEGRGKTVRPYMDQHFYLFTSFVSSSFYDLFHNSSFHLKLTNIKRADAKFCIVK